MGGQQQAQLLRPRWSHRGLLGLVLSALVAPGLHAAGQSAAAFEPDAYLKTYCGRCHNDIELAGNWSLVDLNQQQIAQGNNLELWERVWRESAHNNMPPADRKQPAAAERAHFNTWLQTALDRRAQAHPDPGDFSLRRLNRREFANALRDLLQLDIDFATALPADDSGYGFDNIGDVLTVSATLLDGYVRTARNAARLAVGLGPDEPARTTYQVPKSGSILNQGIPAFDVRMDDRLPLDSRGGHAVDYYAPRDGRYEISGYLNANTNNEVDRLADNRYAATVMLSAGSHTLGMTFRRELALDESTQTLRNDTDIVPLPDDPPRELTLDFIVDGARRESVAVPSYHMSERYAQRNFPRDVLQIDVHGPLDTDGTGAAPALLCRPAETAAEPICARKIISHFGRLAYRRSLLPAELAGLEALFSEARRTADFRAAIAVVLEALLVAPEFLFVIEAAPETVVASTSYRINDLEFATRLALFLWSSLPDDRLLDLAEAKRLRRPRVLRAQIARMLADPRARALTTNFAGQWLYLRNLEHHRPDVMAFPDFDLPLRDAMRRETELFFTATLRDNGSLLNLLDADYSYLNERLAAHYDIDGVIGPQMRRVKLPADSERGGLLGQASILMLTSYANHTSVVKRGQWILDQLLAEPPPPAPPDVPALIAEVDGQPLDARAQLERHRADPACAACHKKMDPLGLALEQYDAIGALRRLPDTAQPIDVSALLPDGTAFNGLGGLKQVLLARKDQFTRAFTEQLLTYALGRGIGAKDQPAIRAIASEAADDGYKIRSIIEGIATSHAFNHRRSTTL